MRRNPSLILVLLFGLFAFNFSDAYAQQEIYDVNISVVLPDGSTPAENLEVILLDSSQQEIGFGRTDMYGFASIYNNQGGTGFPFGPYAVVLEPRFSPDLPNNTIYRRSVNPIVLNDQHPGYSSGSIFVSQPYQLQSFSRFIRVQVREQGTGIAVPNYFVDAFLEQFDGGGEGDEPPPFLNGVTDANGEVLFGLRADDNREYRVQGFGFETDHAPASTFVTPNPGPGTTNVVLEVRRATASLTVDLKNSDSTDFVLPNEGMAFAGVNCYSPSDPDLFAFGYLEGGQSSTGLKLVPSDYVCDAYVDINNQQLGSSRIEFTIADQESLSREITILSPDASINLRIVTSGGQVISGVEAEFSVFTSHETIENGGVFFNAFDLNSNGEATLDVVGGNSPAQCYDAFVNIPQGFGPPGGGDGPPGGGDGPPGGAFSVVGQSTSGERRRGYGSISVGDAQGLGALNASAQSYIISNPFVQVCIQPGEQKTVDFPVTEADGTLNVSVVDSNGDPVDQGFVEAVIPREFETLGSDPHGDELSSLMDGPGGAEFFVGQPVFGGQATLNVITGRELEVFFFPFFEPGENQLTLPSPTRLTLSQGESRDLTIVVPRANFQLTVDTSGASDIDFLGCVAISESGAESFGDAQAGSSSVTIPIVVNPGSEELYEVFCHSVTGFYPNEKVLEGFGIFAPSPGTSEGNLSVALSEIGDFLDEQTFTFACNSSASFTLPNNATITIPANAISSSTGNCKMTVSGGRGVARRSEEYPLVDIDFLFIDDSGNQVTDTNSEIGICVDLPPQRLSEKGISAADVRAAHYDSDTRSFEELSGYSLDETVSPPRLCWSAKTFSVWSAIGRASELATQTRPNTLSCNSNGCNSGSCSVTLAWVAPGNATAATVYEAIATLVDVSGGDDGDSGNVEDDYRDLPEKTQKKIRKNCNKQSKKKTAKLKAKMSKLKGKKRKRVRARVNAKKEKVYNSCYRKKGDKELSKLSSQSVSVAATETFTTTETSVNVTTGPGSINFFVRVQGTEDTSSTLTCTISE